MGDSEKRRDVFLRRTFAVLHLAMGLAAYRLRRFASARDRILRALAIDDRLFRARLFLGRLYVREGDLPRAAEQFRAASRLRPRAFLRYRAEIERTLVRAAVSSIAGAVFLRAADLDDARMRDARLEDLDRPEKGVPSRAGTSILGRVSGGLEEGLDAPRPDADPRSLLRDGVRGDAERRRLAKLPALAPHDVLETDWDSVGRRLVDPHDPES